MFDRLIELLKSGEPRKLVSLRGSCKNGTLIPLENACIQPKPFIFKQKRPDWVSLRGRTAAVAIFKPKAWNPVAKHGSTKRETAKILRNL